MNENMNEQRESKTAIVTGAGRGIGRAIAIALADEGLHVGLLAQRALVQMKKAGGGRIINIASTASTQGYLHQSAYCASKHALLGFARSLAMEAKEDNIHVHTLCPGGVDTRLIEGTYLAKRMQGQPTIRPEDIAKMVVFVLEQAENIDLPEVIVRRFVPG